MLSAFNCRKFEKLSDERDVRELTADELAFFEAHQLACEPCAELLRTSSMSLNMLRMSAMEAEISPTFDEKLMRKLRLQTGRASLNYWSPAVFGAAIAGLAVLAAMQAVARTVDGPNVRKASGEESRLMHNRTFPSLDLGVNRPQNP